MCPRPFLSVLTAATVAFLAFIEPLTASPPEARLMAEAAQRLIVERGFGDACPLFEDTENTDWHKGDMYVFVLSRDSEIICNGSGIRKLDGMRLRGVLDASGQDLFELYEVLSEPAYVKYDFLNPASGAVAQKTSWIIPTADYILGVGTFIQ